MTPPGPGEAAFTGENLPTNARLPGPCPSLREWAAKWAIILTPRLAYSGPASRTVM